MATNFVLNDLDRGGLLSYGDQVSLEMGRNLQGQHQIPYQDPQYQQPLAGSEPNVGPIPIDPNNPNAGYYDPISVGQQAPVIDPNDPNAQYYDPTLDPNLVGGYVPQNEPAADGGVGGYINGLLNFTSINKLGAAGNIHAAADVEVPAVMTALGVNMILFVALVGAYEFFSRIFPSLYLTASKRAVHLPRSILPLSWLPTIARTSWHTVRTTAGLDAYMFLRYIRMCLQITAISGLWGMVILWPVFASGGNGAQGWYHFSMANIMQGNWRLWIPTVFMWLQTFYVLFLMNNEYGHYLECRMEYLAPSQEYLQGRQPKEPSDAPRDEDNDMDLTVAQRQQKYSLMVELIPFELRSDRALFDYFDTLFPGKVHSANVVLNLPDLEAASAKRMRVTRRLEKSVALHEATKRRPTHVVGRKRVNCCGIESLPFDAFGRKIVAEVEDNDDTLPARGQRVDSISYYTRSLSILNETVANMQEEKKAIAESGNTDAIPASQWISHALGVASDAATASLRTGESAREDGLILGFAVSANRVTFCGVLGQLGMDFVSGGFSFLHRHIDVAYDSVVGATMSSTGFVTFKDLTSLTCAVRAPLCHKPDVLQAQVAPEPSDIEWRNAHINILWSAGREWTANIFLFLGAILWSVPVAAIQALATADSLARIPGMGWIPTFDNGHFAAFVNGYLPVMALLGIILLLPIIFQWVAVQYEDRKTLSDVQKSILTRYFYYQLANIYITVSAGSLWDSLADIIDHPSNAFAILGKSLPTVVGYFITLLMTKVLAGLPMVMLRFGSLARLLFLKLMFREKYLSQRELDELYKKEMLLYGWEYPTQLLVIVICFTYACISPVILPVGAIYFLGALIVYKKQALVVYTPIYESGGLMFPSVCHRTLIGLVCGQITLIGYTVLRHGFYQPLFLFPLPFITIGMMQTFKRVYADQAMHLSLERAIELDKVSTATTDFSIDVYRQPVLAESAAEPQPYRVVRDLGESVSTRLSLELQSTKLHGSSRKGIDSGKVV